MSIIQWYPGHIAKAERKLKELASFVDVVVVLVDARVPASSSYPNLSRLIGDKPLLFLLNKADLAHSERTKEWKDFFEACGKKTLITNATTTKEVNQIIKSCHDLGKDSIQKLIAKGRLPRPVRVMVMGMPNVGKSSMINRLVKHTKTKVASKPGVTRSVQWVRINPKVELLDTPGIIPTKFEDQNNAFMIAAVDMVGEKAYETEEVANMLIEKLWKIAPESMKEYYKLPELTSVPKLEEIAIARNLVVSGGEPDTLRCAQKVLSDFRTGKIGNITLESVSEVQESRTHSLR